MLVDSIKEGGLERGRILNIQSTERIDTSSIEQAIADIIGRTVWACISWNFVNFLIRKVSAMLRHIVA